MYGLEIMPKAEADFARLDATIEQRILDKLRVLCENCDTHRHETLRGPIGASSVYALLVLIEFCIPSIDKQERLLFTKLDIGAASISMDMRCVIYFRTMTEQMQPSTEMRSPNGITVGQSLRNRRRCGNPHPHLLPCG